MDLLAAVLAFIGALGGVIVGNLLDRRAKREDERRQRIAEAYRAVATTIARREFAPSIGVTRMHPGVNLADVEARLSREGIERYVSSLREARERVALVALDGVEVGGWWRSDEVMHDHLEDLLALLAGALKS